MKKTAYLLISLILGASLGLAEDHPDLSSPEAREEVADRLIRILPYQVPAEGYNKPRIIRMLEGQNELIETLMNRKSYQKNMAEKGDPLAIYLYRVDSEETQGRQIDEAEFKQVLAQVSDLLKNRKFAGQPLNEIKKQVLSDLIENLIFLNETNPDQLMTGLINSLDDQERKKSLFQMSNSDARMNTLRRLPLYEQMEIGDRFQASRFGLDPKDFDIEMAFELAEEAIARRKSLIAQVYLLHLLERDLIKKGELQKSLKSLSMADFDIFGDENSGVIAEINESIPPRVYQETLETENPISLKAAQRTLASLLAGYSKSNLRVTKSQSQKRILIGAIKEVPAYVGVYRGAVGGDCSTSHSWAFPFSPFERVFFVYNEEGQPVGYATLSMMRTDNSKKNHVMYIKDLQGKSMTADLAEVALHAFYSVSREFGIEPENVLVANPDFTEQENQNEHLTNRYARYNRNERARTVKVKFRDNDIRESILGDQSGSGTSYDSQDYHDHGVQLLPEAKILNAHHFDARVEQFDSEKPVTGKDALIRALGILMADPDANLNDIDGLVPAEVLNVFRALINSDQKNLSTFYDGLGDLLKGFDIEANGRFYRKQEYLLTLGHLRARNAFTHSHEPYVNRSKRLLTAAIRGDAILERMIPILKQHKRAIEKEDLFSKVAEQLAKRGGAIELYRLMTLGLGEVAVARQTLNQDKTKQSLQVLMEKWMSGELQLAIGDLNGWPEELASRLDNSKNESVIKFRDRILAHLQKAGLDLSFVTSGPLMRRYHTGLLRAGNLLNPASAANRRMGIEVVSETLSDPLNNMDRLKNVADLLSRSYKKLENSRKFKASIGEFIRKFDSVLSREDRFHALPILLILADQGRSDAKTYLSKLDFRETLSSIHDSRQRILFLYALSQRNRIEVQASDITPEMLAILDTEKAEDADVKLAENLMEILIQFKTEDPIIQKELWRTIKYDDDSDMRIRAAIAFLTNGGVLNEKYLNQIEVDLEKTSLDPSHIERVETLLKEARQPKQCAQAFQQEEKSQKSKKKKRKKGNQ